MFRKRFSRKQKRILFAFGSILLFLITLTMSGLIFFHTPYVQNIVRRSIQRTVTLFYPIELGFDSIALRFDGFSPTVRLRGLWITQNAHPANRLDVERVDVRLASLESTFAALSLHRVIVSKARITLSDLSQLSKAYRTSFVGRVARDTFFKVKVGTVELSDVDVVGLNPAFPTVDRKIHVHEIAIEPGLAGAFRINNLRIETTLLRSNVQIPIDWSAPLLEWKDKVLTLPDSRALIFLEPVSIKGQVDFGVTPIRHELQLSTQFSAEKVDQILEKLNVSRAHFEPGALALRLETKGSGPTVSFALHGSEARMWKFPVTQYRIAGTLNYPRIEIQKLDLDSPYGSIAGTGEYDLVQKDGAVDLSLFNVRLFDRFRELGITRKLAGPISGELTGTINGAGEQWFTGKAALSVEAFRVRTMLGSEVVAIPKVDILQSVGLTRSRLLTEGTVAAPNLEVKSSGEFIFRQSMKLSYTGVFSGEGSAAVGHLFGRPISGSGTVSGELFGPYRELVNRNTLDLKKLRFGALALDQTQGRLDWENSVLRARELLSSTTDYGVRVNGGIRFFPDRSEFSDLQFAVRTYETQPILEFVSTQSVPSIFNSRVSLQGRLSGSLTRPSGVVILETRSGRLFTQIPYDRLFSHVRLKSGRIEIEEASIAFGSERSRLLQLRGVFDPDGDSDLAVLGRNLTIRDVLPESVGQALQIQGQLLLRGRLTGPLSDLRVEGVAETRNTQLAQGPVGESRIAIERRDRRTSISALLFGGEVRSSVKFSEGQLSASVQSSEFNLYPWLLSLSRTSPGIEDRSGTTLMVSGQFELTANRQENKGWWVQTHSGVLSKFRLARGLYSLELQKPIQWKREENRFHLDGGTFVEGNHTLLLHTASGVPVRLRLSGSMSLGFLALFVPTISRADGTAELDLSVTWTGWPSVQGRITLSEASVAVQILGTQLAKTSARLTLAANTFRLDSLDAELNGGSLRATGKGRFSAGGIDEMNLVANLNSVALPRQWDASGLLSGRITLTKDQPAAPLLVGGQVELADGRYRKPIKISDLLLTRQSRSYRIIQQGRRDRVRYGLKMTTRNPFLVENNLLKSALMADLELTGTEGDLGLLGSVTFESGEFYYYGHAFRLVSGAIRFTRPTEFFPEYELVGEAEIHSARIEDTGESTTLTYLVTLRAYGSLDQPKIILSSVPSLSPKDVLSLIQFGTTTTDNQESTVDRNSGIEGLALSFGFLKEQLGGDEFVKSRVPLIDRLTLFPVFSQATGRTELMLTVGIDWIPNLLALNYSRFLSSPLPEDQFRVDLLLHPNVALVGSWKSHEQRGYDLGADLRFRFEVE